MTETLPPCLPPTRLEAWKRFIGELARPFAVIATSASAAVATVMIAWRVEGFEDGAIFIGAVYTGVAGIYGFKAWEARKQHEQAAQVEIAKTAAAPVAAPPAGSAAVIVTPPAQVEVMPAPAAEDLPGWERPQ